MSENPRSSITISLGHTSQVVKRGGGPLDGSSGDSQSTMGRKRSVKDRLSGVGDPTPGFNNKRLRSNGKRVNQADSTDDMGLRANDLRFKLMQKNICKDRQSNNQQSVVDLRDLLSRPAQSLNASVAASPNIHEVSHAKQRFPELGNGKNPMYEMREPKKHMAESRTTRHDISEVTNVRPRMQERNSSGNTGRVHSTPAAGSLSHMSMLKSSSSPWTSERLRRRSPDVALRHRPKDVGSRQRSPDASLRWRSSDEGFRQRSPGVGFRQRSPNVASRQRSSGLALRRRSPDIESGRRSPAVALRRRSPNVSIGRRSPDIALGRRSPDVASMHRSPNSALRRRSPDIALRRRSPDVALRRRSPNVALRRRSPDIAFRRGSPDIVVRRRSPDVVLSPPRFYSPSIREEEIHRGSSVRSNNDKGVGTYVRRDVHEFSRLRPSMPCMRTPALPAAHAYMSKEVHDFSRPGPSVPYMATAAVHSTEMMPLPNPSMLPNNLVQRSSYKKDGPSPEYIFLRSLRLEKYCINLEAAEVDLSLLRQMSEKDLKALGIPMGPRITILSALQSRYNRQV